MAYMAMLINESEKPVLLWSVDDVCACLQGNEFDSEIIAKFRGKSACF